MQTPATPSEVQRRVLVADDNTDAADTIAMLLESIGCEVRVVYDGDAAVREAHDFAPELALIDLGMPLVSGYDACRRIRAEPWGAGITLFALTGWGQDEDRRRSADAGFDGHLVKPVDADALIALARAPRLRS